MEILEQVATQKEEFPSERAIACNRCGLRPAEIFQATGDFCIDCWQTITHTDA